MTETYGFDALQKTFDNLAYKDKRGIILTAFRKATKPTIELAKQNAPTGRTGNLRKSIGMVPVKEESAVWIGARVVSGFKGFHSHLVENGTVERWYMTKKGKKHPTGKMNPNAIYAHFWKRSLDATEKQLWDTVQVEWNRAIEKFIEKGGKDK